MANINVHTICMPKRFRPVYKSRFLFTANWIGISKTHLNGKYVTIVLNLPEKKSIGTTPPANNMRTEFFKAVNPHMDSSLNAAMPIKNSKNYNHFYYHSNNIVILFFTEELNYGQH